MTISRGHLPGGQCALTQWQVSVGESGREQTQGRRPCGDGVKAWSHAAACQRTPRATGKAARPARVLPGSLRRERGLPTPWFHCLRLGANPGLLFQAARLVTVVHPLWPKVHHRSFLKCSSELRLYPSFPHSGNKCLLSTYCVPGTPPGLGGGYRDRNGPRLRGRALFC